MAPLARAPLLSRFGARARDGGNSLPLPFAIAVSLLLHGVILSITFTTSEPPPRQEVRQLDVVLVNARREKPPEEADVLAQANLDGGGNSSAEDARPSTPTPRRQEIERGDALADARRAAPPPTPATPPPQPAVKPEATPPAPPPEPLPEPEPAPAPTPLPEPPAPPQPEPTPAPQPEAPPVTRALPEPQPTLEPEPEPQRQQFTFDSPEPLRDEPPPPPPPPVLTAIERPVITPPPPRPALPEPRVEPQPPPVAAPAPAPLPEPAKPAAPPAPPPEPPPAPVAAPVPAPAPERPPQPIPAPEPTPEPAPQTEPQPQPQPQPQRSLPSGADLMNSVAAIARLEAQIDRRLDEFSKRPRKVQIGSRAREHRFAQYAEDWRQKVERIGTLNYPDAARGKLYGTLVLTVAIRADGTVERIVVDRSSGHEVLDRAAIDIVRLAAPYAPFPPDIRVDTDIVEITRTWSFTNSDQLRTR